MKQLLLFTFFSMAVAGISAQSLTLSDSQGPVANGDTITVVGDTNATIEAHIFITNILSSTVNFKVKKIEIDTIPGTSNMFCFNNICFPSDVTISPNAMTLAANNTTGMYVDGFYGDYDHKGIIGTSKIMYVFFLVIDPHDSVAVTVNYYCSPVSIYDMYGKNIEFSDAYPNPTRNFTSFNYILPENTEKSRLVIKNILGSSVKEADIFDKEGKLTINVSNLTEGLYFYTLFINEKAVLTKKFIVKR